MRISDWSSDVCSSDLSKDEPRKVNTSGTRWACETAIAASISRRTRGAVRHNIRANSQICNTATLYLEVECIPGGRIYVDSSRTLLQPQRQTGAQMLRSLYGFTKLCSQAHPHASSGPISSGLSAILTYLFATRHVKKTGRASRRERMGKTD